MILNIWLEIERKFKISEDKLPSNYKEYPCDKIEQWYLIIKEEREERIRHRWNRYYYTTKTWLWEVREEDEYEITSQEFESLWEKTVWKRIEKIRYLIPYNEKTIELDIYQWKNKWLIIAEIEFNSLDEADNFIFPDWFWEDVTNNPSYKNRNLIW